MDFETRRGTDIPIVLVVLETQEPQSCYGIDKILVKRRKWCGVEKTECWKARDIYTPRPRTSSSRSHHLDDAARSTHYWGAIEFRTFPHGSPRNVFIFLYFAWSNFTCAKCNIFCSARSLHRPHHLCFGGSQTMAASLVDE